MITNCNAGFLEKSEVPRINLTPWQCQLIAGYIRRLARESLTSNFNNEGDYNSVFFNDVWCANDYFSFSQEHQIPTWVITQLWIMCHLLSHHHHPDFKANTVAKTFYNHENPEFMFKKSSALKPIQILA